MSADTIAAIATPPGVGGVGIVRVSGSESPSIARSLTGRILHPRFATYCPFRAADGTLIDHGIALFFPGPRSFTGEDVLELQGHGGRVVMDMLLYRCLELGARPARPGEFSQRAFLNGKIDLAQAEAIADLVESATSLAAKLALRSLHGAFSRQVETLVEDLIHQRTLIEATLDFPEDEIDPRTREGLQTGLCTLIACVDRILSEAQQGERIRDGLTVVIAGRPNSGKSCLFNALVQSDVAIVTPVPGTTRDLLRCDIQIDGLPVKMIDTAGIRDTDELVEQEGVRRTRKQLCEADHILWVYDCRAELQPDELTELPPQVPATLVRNKIDLEARDSGAVAAHPFAQVRVSALTGLGIDQLRQHLRSQAGINGLGEGSFMARRRHLEALRRGLAALQSANDALENGAGPEVIAFELVQAQQAFGEITGDFTPDDLLERVFSTFCIGK